MYGSLVLFCDLITTGVNYIKHFVRVWQLQGSVLWQSDTQQSFVLGWLLLDPISFRSLLGETSQPATEVNKIWDESTRKPDWNTAPSSRSLHNSRVCGHEEGEGRKKLPEQPVLPPHRTPRGEADQPRATSSSSQFVQDGPAAVLSARHSVMCGRPLGCVFMLVLLGNLVLIPIRDWWSG